jgi:3-hydroxy-9,10-secoandrosta-1,3,5(10)-triene-9,17-dione monooxygenase reductase component
MRPKTASPHDPAPGGRSFPESYLGYRLARASFLVTSAFHDELENAGVSVSTWRILTSVMDHDRTISEIGDLVLMKQSTLSRALDRLERDKLIARKRLTTERRSVYVALTPAGRKLAVSLRMTAEQHEGSIRGRVPQTDLRQLGEILDRLIATLSK